MFDLGDDIIIDSYRIPWLIWIQILIMFLLTLTILLSFFGLFELDSSSPTNTNDFSLSISSSIVGPPPICSLRTQVAQNHVVQREVAGNRSRNVGNNAERDGSLAKDSASAPNTERFFHPCRYFNFAKTAFLKCLGLGSVPRNPSGNEHEHED